MNAAYMIVTKLRTMKTDDGAYSGGCCVSLHISVLWDFLLFSVSPSVRLIIYFYCVVHAQQSIVKRGSRINSDEGSAGSTAM